MGVMKGHIYKRAKGSWTIVYDLPIDPVTGKRRQKSQTVKGIKRDAERALREIITSIEQGAYVKPNKMTVGELLNSWLDDYVSMNTTDRTQESYKYLIQKHIIPSLGRIPLSELQPQHIQSYYAEKLKGGLTISKGSGPATYREWIQLSCQHKM
jgi:integrase